MQSGVLLLHGVWKKSKKMWTGIILVLQKSKTLIQHRKNTYKIWETYSCLSCIFNHGAITTNRWEIQKESGQICQNICPHCSATGTRTLVSGVRGQRPRPLDDSTILNGCKSTTLSRYDQIFWDLFSWVRKSFVDQWFTAYFEGLPRVA